MARLRRSLLCVFAIAALVCGYGWTVAAMACPSTIVAASAPVRKDGACGPSAPHGCAVPYCGPVCVGVTPAVAAVTPSAAVPADFHGDEARILHDQNFGPEPPPPRTA